MTVVRGRIVAPMSAVVLVVLAAGPAAGQAPRTAWGARIHLPGRHEPEMSLEAASFGGAPRVGLTDAGSHTGCLHRGRCRGRSRAACRLSTGGVHRRRNGPARTAEPRRAARSGMSRTLLN